MQEPSSPALSTSASGEPLLEREPLPAPFVPLAHICRANDDAGAASWRYYYYYYYYYHYYCYYKSPHSLSDSDRRHAHDWGRGGRDNLGATEVRLATG